MKKYKIRECSDVDYEGMVVDIVYEDSWFATLSCDEGIEKAIIKIFDPIEEKVIWEMDFSSIQEVLNKAFQKLKEANCLE